MSRYANKASPHENNSCNKVDRKGTKLLKPLNSAQNNAFSAYLESLTESPRI